MKIISSPWKKTFLDLVSKSKESIKITSPFIKENICDELLAIKNKNAELEIITSFKFNSIYSGSLDISAVEKIINANGKVSNFSKLHSKIYLFDNKEVVITSGNLTNGGLINNYEYGIHTSDKKIICQVINDFDLLKNDEKTGKIELKHIIEVQTILGKMLPNNATKLPNYKIETPELIDDIVFLENNIIEESLKGWKLDVFKCLNRIDGQVFNLSDVYSFENEMKIIHPSNTEIKPKMRQQLQNLRDIGLIEFLGNGNYRKLWK